MTKRFENKVAIVTGSSNGIGRAVAVLFASEGAKVTIHGRNEESIKETQKELHDAGVKESDVLVVRGDIREEKVQKSLVEETVAKFGKINILVNNAGGLPEMSPRHGFDQTNEEWDYTIDLNVKSVLNLTKLAISHLISAKGEIVNISSIASLPVSMASSPYYSAAKAALDQLTRALAARYIHNGVRVNSVNPGVVQTKIMAKQGISDELYNEINQKMLQNRHNIPAGIVGTPKNIADAVAFLADRDSSSYIVGHCLVIDGGTTLNVPLFNSFEPENYDYALKE
ncbi:unnamed protein product [Caenorhabditis auriculariae]|uniref:Uncharacterized protein n=1 Tax=Caenorhabditis auriculariae TaxID=2777116 RepID=A0A8S1H7E4_9PELO|nr:unnamed protein product [Caenorhabditis auriculariae]